MATIPNPTVPVDESSLDEDLTGAPQLVQEVLEENPELAEFITVLEPQYQPITGVPIRNLKTYDLVLNVDPVKDYVRYRLPKYGSTSGSFIRYKMNIPYYAKTIYARPPYSEPNETLYYVCTDRNVAKKQEYIVRDVITSTEIIITPDECPVIIIAVSTKEMPYFDRKKRIGIDEFLREAFDETINETYPNGIPDTVSAKEIIRLQLMAIAEVTRLAREKRLEERPK